MFVLLNISYIGLAQKIPMHYSPVFLPMFRHRRSKYVLLLFSLTGFGTQYHKIPSSWFISGFPVILRSTRKLLCMFRTIIFGNLHVFMQVILLFFSFSSIFSPSSTYVTRLNVIWWDPGFCGRIYISGCGRPDKKSAQNLSEPALAKSPGSTKVVECVLYSIVRISNQLLENDDLRFLFFCFVSFF